MAEELCVRLVPLFNQLDRDRQLQIERLVHHRHVERGTIVASPTKNDCLVIIERGQARLYQLNADGEEQTQRILSTGEFVGETWILGIRNNNNYVEATTESDICILNRDDFVKLLQDHHEITLKMLTIQAEVISYLRRQIELMGLPSITERLATYLEMLAEEQGDTTVTIPLKMKDLSSYLGTTPETLSRQFTRLEKQGKIKRHRRTVTLLS